MRLGISSNGVAERAKGLSPLFLFSLIGNDAADVPLVHRHKKSPPPEGGELIC